MTAITISRQFGSLGNEIARQVGERLGYRVVRRELVNQAGRRAGVPEMALDTIDDLGLLGVKPSAKARQAYHHALQQVMAELADEGNVVILGRAGQAILKERPDVVHVRVIAPPDLRAERIARAQSIPLAAAREQVAASDRARRDYVRYYHADWDDPALYDLVINTGHLTPGRAADLVCLAVQHR